MKVLDLSIPLGVATPPWPTYEPLQVKYFKRIAPNGANGQLVTHSNHLGTHLDGEIHFHTRGKDIASLSLNDFLVGGGAIVDLSDAAGEWIARLQTPEYALKATGWVRAVSALQLVISVYLVPLWVLTYFGRPFE